ncbi:MAG: class I SAM-dependent methyltransferase [Prochlorococcaceae cyanobacterium]|jgi:hypothetical protein
MNSDFPSFPSLVNFISQIDSGLPASEFEMAETLMFHQTLTFYMDIVSVIQDLLPGYETIRILDVGSRTGAGANLMGFVFSENSYSRIKAEVTALDIEDRFQKYSITKFPWIKEYVVDDIFNVSSSWDIVVCSHTIEHVYNYTEFINEMRSKTKRYLIVLAPYDEANCKLIKDIPMCEGHINSITHDSIASFSPIIFKIYRSLVWHQSLAFLAVIPGTAAY